MSDLTMFPMNLALEHHTLEVEAAQWDGTREKAMQITQDLKTELPLRDAELVAAHHRIDQNRDGAAQHLELTIVRRSDGEKYMHVLAPDDWIAVWLHQDRVYMVVRMGPAEGEVFFRRVAPVVVLANRRGIT